MSAQQTNTRRSEPSIARKPPKLLMKVVNPVMKRVLRGRRGSKVGDVLMLITFKGRKTGKTYTTPVGYWRDGDTVLAFTDSPWGKNLLGGAPVKVVVQGREYKAVADATNDPDEVARVMQRYMEKNGPQSARRLGLLIDTSRQPTFEELLGVTGGRVIIRVNLAQSKT